jgi:UPF0755 protein
MRSRRRLEQLALALGLAALAAWLCAGLLLPAGPSSRKRVIAIAPGTSAYRALHQLADRGCLRSPKAVWIASLLTGKWRHIRRGKHLLSPSLTGWQVLRRLAGQAPTSHWITLPEGFTLRQIAAALEENGLARAGVFLAAARQASSFPTPFPKPADSLEGYLFPDTYQVALDATEQDIIRQMLARFDQVVWQGLLGGKPPPGGRSLHELVTLASLVEGEAKKPGERALIAGVLVNRVRTGRRLECDATIQYLLGEDRKPRLLYKDLQTDSPYNTYLHPGLPPGPINSPGLASLRAALHPASTPYLYYVARPDGSHVFSRTLAQHDAAKRSLRPR